MVDVDHCRNSTVAHFMLFFHYGRQTLYLYSLSMQDINTDIKLKICWFYSYFGVITSHVRPKYCYRRKCSSKNFFLTTHF